MKNGLDLDVAIGRREFTAGSIMALLGGITVTIAGCSSDSNPGNPTGNPGTGDKAGSVSANHGHVATVSAAEIMAGNAVLLRIRGSGDHDHTLSLTADEVRAVGAGTRTAKTSSNDLAHDHIVTFNP